MSTPRDPALISDLIDRDLAHRLALAQLDPRRADLTGPNWPRIPRQKPQST